MPWVTFLLKRKEPIYLDDQLREITIFLLFVAKIKMEKSFGSFLELARCLLPLKV